MSDARRRKYTKGNALKRKRENQMKTIKMNKTLKHITMTLCLLSVCLLTACSTGTSASASSAATAASDSKLDKIKAAGVLVVATSPDYPPNEYLDASGNAVGSEIDLAQYIADSLGVKLQVETMDFNAVLTAVDTGKADLAISGFGYKKDRAENFELSIGYQGDSEAACHTLLVPSEDADTYKTLDDYSGKTIAVQASSLQQMYVEDEIPEAEAEIVTQLDQAILSLNTGKVDAVALDCTSAGAYAASSNGAFAVSTVQFDLTPYADYAGNVIACKKGETELIDAVNEIITEVNDKGLYVEWYAAAKADAGIED